MTTTLSEEQVIDGFHSFLQTALAQARAERLLDADTLASAEADLMISGPALCLFFGALRATTHPPSVPLPRQRADKSMEPVRLSLENCPPTFLPFLRVWASCVPRVQTLPSQHQHDLARVICDLPPLNQPVYSGVTAMAADLRAVALEISQRRTFQERYQADLQAALDVGRLGRGSRRTGGPSATAHFTPPPMYSEKDTSSSSTKSRTPEPPPQPQTPTFPEPQVPPEQPPAAGPSRSSPPPDDDPSMTLIRETLFASLGDVFASTPSLAATLKTDPARAYFASAALAILNVSTEAVTAAGSVRGVMGRELTWEACPPSLQPLMRDLAAIGEEAKAYAAEDDEEAIRLAARGKPIPPESSRMDRVRRILESGVGYDSGQQQQQEEGRRSVEGRAVQLANRISKLALVMTGLPAFRSYAKDVFDILGALA